MMIQKLTDHNEVKNHFFIISAKKLLIILHLLKVN